MKADEQNKIKLNVEKAREIINFLTSIEKKKEKLTEYEIGFLSSVELSMLNQLKLINAAIKGILQQQGGKKKEIVIAQTKTKPVFILKKQKQDFMKELQITESSLDRIKKILKKSIVLPKEKKQSLKPSMIVLIASRMFGKIGLRLSNKDTFGSLKSDLRKANIPLLLSTYISLMLYLTFMSFIFAFLVASIASFIHVFSMTQLLKNVAVSLIIPPITFVLLFVYPSMQAKSIDKKINAELPFAALYMAAISSSGIGPTKVFDLMARSKEYKNIARETRKIVNKMNVYGLDLVSAIKDSLRNISNKKFVELLNGVATTIATGGNLQTFFEQKASSLFVNYRLERRKFMAASGTYADIYTGLLITAPLIFMLVLLLINLLGTSIAGLTPLSIAVLSIGAIIMLNIGFLMFLQLTQPPG